MEYETTLYLRSRGKFEPKLDAVTAAITNVNNAQQQAATVSKNAPGSVSINTPGLSFGPGSESAMSNYTARYGGSSLGMIGGGPHQFSLSWAMK